MLRKTATAKRSECECDSDTGPPVLTSHHQHSGSRSIAVVAVFTAAPSSFNTQLNTLIEFGKSFSLVS